MLLFDTLPDPEILELDPELRRLIGDRIEDAIACGLGDLTEFLVVEPGDTEADIVDAIGFSPLVHRIHGTRNEPDWDWRERHKNWTELLYIVDGTSFAYTLFVQEAEGVIPELISIISDTL